MAANPRQLVVGVVLVFVVVGAALGATAVLGIGGSMHPLVSASGQGTPGVTETPGATPGQSSSPTPDSSQSPDSTPAPDRATATTGTGEATTATPTPSPTPTPVPDADDDGLDNEREDALNTDPQAADTDADGLEDGREVALGADPLHPDTDADRLDDGREVAVGTDLLAADTDGDGLEDGRELAVGADPLAADADADGLEDGREIAVGSDPHEQDTDDDQLLDSWEARGRIPGRGTLLPNASATQMDIYVQINYGKFSSTLTERDLEIIAEEFQEMPVENPDGSRGIDVHVDDEPPYGGVVNDSIHVSGPGESFDDARRTYYDETYLGNRTGVYHLVLVGHVDAENSAGYGEAPGLFSVVEEDVTAPYSESEPDEERVVIHELLHNVVGDYTAAANTDGEGYHTFEGYLQGPPPVTPYDGEWNVSFTTERELQVNGLKAPAGPAFPPAGRSEDGGGVAAFRRHDTTGHVATGPVLSDVVQDVPGLTIRPIQRC